MKLLTMCLILGLALLVAPLAHACNPPVQQFAVPQMSYQMQTVQTVQTFAAPVQTYAMPVQQFAAPMACQTAAFAAPVQRYHTASFAAPMAVQSGFLGASAGNASAGIGFGGGSFVNNGKIKIKNGRGAGRIR